MKQQRFIKDLPRGFKGIWIPRSLWLDVRLTPKEVMLIAEIDSLDVDGKGCYASNQYLGRFLGVSGGRVANMLTRLRKLRLVSTISFDGRRRFLKVALTKTVKGGLTETVKAPLSETVKERIKERRKEETVAGTCARRRSPKLLDLHREGDNDKPERVLCRTLYKIVYPHLKGLPNKLPKKDLNTGKRDWRAWEREFKTLLKQVPFDEVIKTMEWYGHHFGKQYVPEIHSAKSFHDKYLNILLAIKRQQQDQLRKQQEDGEYSEGEGFELFDIDPEEHERLQQEEEEYNRQQEAWRGKRRKGG